MNVSQGSMNFCQLKTLLTMRLYLERLKDRPCLLLTSFRKPNAMISARSGRTVRQSNHARTGYTCRNKGAPYMKNRNLNYRAPCLYFTRWRLLVFNKVLCIPFDFGDKRAEHETGSSGVVVPAHPCALTVPGLCKCPVHEVLIH